MQGFSYRWHDKWYQGYKFSLSKDPDGIYHCRIHHSAGMDWAVEDSSKEITLPEEVCASLYDALHHVLIPVIPPWFFGFGGIGYELIIFNGQNYIQLNWRDSLPECWQPLAQTIKAVNEILKNNDAL